VRGRRRRGQGQFSVCSATRGVARRTLRATSDVQPAPRRRPRQGKKHKGHMTTPPPPGQRALLPQLGKSPRFGEGARAFITVWLLVGERRGEH
jgi:hypothetical protein